MCGSNLTKGSSIFSILLIYAAVQYDSSYDAYNSNPFPSILSHFQLLVSIHNYLKSHCQYSEYEFAFEIGIFHDTELYEISSKLVQTV